MQLWRCASRFNATRQNCLEIILHEHTARFGVEVSVTKQVYECTHCTERLEKLAMIVLLLPNEEGRFTLRALTYNYFAPVEVNELQREECGYVDGNGIGTYTYKRSLCGKKMK